MYDKSYTGKIFDSNEKLRSHIGSGSFNWFSRHDTFWASVNYNDPRDTYFLVAQYDAAINFVDNEMIIPLVQKLKELGIYDDTLIIFTADHGEAFKEHSGEAFREHNNFLHRDLYNGVLHVPLIMVYPKGIPRNRVVGQLVRLIDIMPTILDIVGIKINTYVQGKSLISAIAKNRFLGLSCYSEHASSYMKAMRTTDYTFIRNIITSRKGGTYIRRSLFNRQADPTEKNDIAMSSPDIVHRLERQLNKQIKHNKRLSAPYRQIEIAPPDSETLEKLKSLGYM
jgi:arylsulfatase A-like enzyme